MVEGLYKSNDSRSRYDLQVRNGKTAYQQVYNGKGAETECG